MQVGDSILADYLLKAAGLDDNQQLHVKIACHNHMSFDNVSIALEANTRRFTQVSLDDRRLTTTQELASSRESHSLTVARGSIRSRGSFEKAEDIAEHIWPMAPSQAKKTIAAEENQRRPTTTRRRRARHMCALAVD